MKPSNAVRNERSRRVSTTAPAAISAPPGLERGLAPRPSPAESLHVAGFGPGKVILLGEHGVVYGHAALAAPLSRGVRAFGTPSERTSIEIPSTLSGDQQDALERAFARAAKRCGYPPISVTLSSEVPVSVGLGSSAALAVAVAHVLLGAKGLTEPKPKQVEELALEMEREFHGTPSGVDHTTSARGELILFEKSRVRAVPSPKPLRVLIAVVGERRSTKATVAALRERQAKWKPRYARIFAEIGALSKEGAKAVAKADLEQLGDLMNMNQGLLSSLGLSSEPIEKMVYTLRGMGALGAKLTGAGGDGGAVVALFREPEPAAAKLLAQGVTCFASQLAGPRAL